MRGVDAERVQAQVVKRQTFRDRPDVEFVRDPVREALGPAPIQLAVKVAVPIATDCSDPLPATDAVTDLRVETFPFVPWFGALHSTDFTEHIGHFLMAAVRENEGVAA